MSDSHAEFTGSIPKLYETHLVPLIFEPYAADIAERLRSMSLSRVLEIAAGTGVVTRALASSLPADVAIVATDLNQPMLDEAASIGTARPVEWRQADAMALPFDDGSFDAIVCQFGAMFFPDKPKAFAEARRVLRPGGKLVFSVWDRIDHNEFAHVISKTLASKFSHDPPAFLERTPYGYSDPFTIERDLATGGFDVHECIDVVPAVSQAASAKIPAVAFCQGTPLRGEIETRAPGRLEEITTVCADALAERFGPSQVQARIQALVFCLDR